MDGKDVKLVATSANPWMNCKFATHFHGAAQNSHNPLPAEGYYPHESPILSGHRQLPNGSPPTSSAPQIILYLHRCPLPPKIHCISVCTLAPVQPHNVELSGLRVSHLHAVTVIKSLALPLTARDRLSPMETATHSISSP
ncbi:hypothetical protein L484_007338 [Morus notabilis]|uniref:Uncharacterized protein n=1 Tax=Morus notabilis TaxID=981085 RepID=W9RHF6_9ROSA|nr:hypothetical protein L484_007338 [Morus notabilis]